jgi:hypothetical protein
MNFKFGLLALLAASVIPGTALAQVPAGRWEIVHTSGDSTAQTNMYPGGFSTYLYSGGTGDTASTTSNSICVVDETVSNVVPSWTSLEGEVFQITITVNNQGLGPNFSFVYTGTYNALTPVPGDLTLEIPAISGTYYYTGNASACSTATEATPGTFVATFLPDLTSGSTSGTLDGNDTQDGTPFDTAVGATMTFSAPPTAGELAGTVSLATNPTLGGKACFATTSGTPNPLTINSSLSTEAGIFEYVYAQGLDSQGNATTLFLQGYSANLYTTTNNTDVTANQMTSDEWAAGAAIGEDDPDTEGTQGIGTTGVQNDGSNNAIVVFYSVIGGVCDGAGGYDAPFHFLSGTPIRNHHNQHHRKHHPRAKEIENRFI